MRLSVIASFSVEALVATSSASVPKELIATEIILGSDTLLFCAPETLFFLYVASCV